MTGTNAETRRSILESLPQQIQINKTRRMASPHLNLIDEKQIGMREGQLADTEAPNHTVNVKRDIGDFFFFSS